MITNKQAIAKKKILDLINIRMDEMRTERNNAMSKVSSLRIKLIQTGDKDLAIQLEDAEMDLKIVRMKDKALEEAMIQVNNGFGW